MIIERVDPNRESFNDFSLEETILTISDQVIDLAIEEGDQQVIISFGSCGGKIHRGLMPCCIHAVDVVIPPRKYETVEVDGPPQGRTISENDEELPATHTETVPIPLDAESVVLKVWPIEVAENNQEEDDGSE